MIGKDWPGRLLFCPAFFDSKWADLDAAPSPQKGGVDDLENFNYAAGTILHETMHIMDRTWGCKSSHLLNVKIWKTPLSFLPTFADLAYRVDPDIRFLIKNKRDAGLQTPYWPSWISALALTPEQFEMRPRKEQIRPGQRASAVPDT